jgi:tagatose-1,6-bisphosphate aldolase
MQKEIQTTYNKGSFVLDEPLLIPENARLRLFIDVENSGADQAVEGYEVRHVPLLKSVEISHSTKQNGKNLLRLLRSWREEDDQGEQKKTYDYLKKVLDEGRLSDRRLFE